MTSDEANERTLRGPKGDQGELGMTRGARRGFVYLSVLMVLLAAAILIFTAREIDAANTRARAQCQFDADIGGAPIAVNVATGKAALLSVSIVSDARVAWRQTGCDGRLDPPTPSFVHWARYYHLPVN